MKKAALNLRWPTAGLVRRRSYQDQAPYATDDALNVYPDDPILDRERGGSRWGAKKFGASQLGSGNPVRLLSTVRYVESGALATDAIASSNGVTYRYTAGDWATVGGDTVASDRLVTAAEHGGKLYVVGNDQATRDLMVLTPGSSATITTATATGGTIPTKCTIVTTIFDRIFMAGDLTDGQGHLWYASKRGDPLNFDYTNTTFDGAVAATTQEFAGRIGDNITALIRHTNECMVIGCSSSIHVLRGDPRSFGQLQVLNDNIGILSQGSWCHSAENWCFAMTPDGLYAMPPGCGRPFVDVSKRKLPQELRNLNPDDYEVLLEYDYTLRAIHIYVTKLSGSAGTGHFLVDTKMSITGDEENPYTCSYWPVSLQTSHEPYSVHSFNDQFQATTDSVVMIGGTDGYVRVLASDQQDDDGSNFASHVLLGPFDIGGTAGFHEGAVDRIRGVTGLNSGDVDWEVYVGRTPEEAYDNTQNGSPVAQGEWNEAGFNRWSAPRARGTYCYIKLTNGQNATKWALENILVEMAQQVGLLRE